MERSPLRAAAACAGIVFVLIGGGWQAQAQTARIPGSFLRGQAAIRGLGRFLPLVARRHGYTPERLAGLLARDSDLAVDGDGALLTTCTFLPPAELTVDAESLEAAIPLAAPFQLHSRPGSTHKIYLDFDGHTVTGTSWNAAFTSGATIVSQPFDADGNPSSLGSSELAAVQEVWARVSEDYAPFDVDVTTEDPGVDGLRRTLPSDNAYGVRILITRNATWYPNGGGVAYIGTFAYSTVGADLPGFVFADRLQNQARNIAEAASHEAGHTLGLGHDGQNGITQYYAGHGNWAPIMGMSYSKAVTQWSKGEYSGANNQEDDLQVIHTHGAPLLADDHGKTFGNGTPFNVAAGGGSGIITSAADQDVFRLTVPTGTLRLQALPSVVAPNLDVSLHLYDSQNNHVAGADNAGSLGASLSATVAAGTYYAVVKGDGSGSPQSSGYSSYASVGPYTLSVQDPPLTLTAPNGGENWAGGTTHSITWASSGVSGNVKLDLSTDGGSSWSPIAASTPNDGEYAWVVPGIATGQARVRASAVTGAGTSDVSDAGFTITAGAPTGILKSPARVSFGTLRVGKTKSVRVVLVNASATASLVVSVGTPSAPFRIAGGGGSLTVAPRKKATVTLVYEPVAAGTATGTLTLTSTDPNKAVAAISLTGKAK
jgi:hypothetical protein